mmetsp:Transcript_51238/g.146301  ORF Transcript_51238/g.146301 Transcript_51238/m.146301 type:complete len:249 (+) Transcript_51238:654-1400(+)
MHQSACERAKSRRRESQTEGSALLANQRCRTGGCRGRTCLVKVSWRSLLWSNSSLISRGDCCWPGLRRFQRSSMMCRIPRVLETHSISPHRSVKMTTLKVWTSRLRLRASGFFCRSWLTMAPNCIILASFLKSPRLSALHKNGYSLPSLPRKVIFLGLSLVLNTSTVSKHFSVKTASGKGWKVARSSRLRSGGATAVICACSGTKTAHLSDGLAICPSSLGKGFSRLMVVAPSGGLNVASPLRSAQTW